MPAPNLYVLHDHEALIEDALVPALAAHGLSGVYTRRSTEDVRDTRVDLFVEAGGAVDHEAPDNATGTGQPEQDRFVAAVSVVVLTERVEEARSSISGITGKHAERVARARVAMTRGSLATNWPSDSYLGWFYVSFDGASSSVNEQRGVDETALSFTLFYRILDNSWPT